MQWPGAEASAVKMLKPLLLLMGSLMLMTAACASEPEAVPVAERQTVAPEATSSEPQKVTGCLAAGEAANTFVLAATAEDGVEPVTYNLQGDTESLRPHVGQRVEIDGLVTAAARATATGTMEPANADDLKEEGTAGKVRTETELAVKALDVRGVRPLGDACGD